MLRREHGSSLWCCLFRQLSLGKMHMGENMILTEAVVTCTFAAIAELKIGIVRIRPSADSALMMVSLLLGLPLLMLRRFFELHRLGAVAIGGAIRHIVYLRPDKHGEV